MLIDSHTHAFADKIATKAVDQLKDYYQLPTEFGGTLKDLCLQGNAATLDAMVLLVAATRPDQVRPANDWILSQLMHTPFEMAKMLQLEVVPRIIPFGAFHPEDVNWQYEIARLRQAGIRGIKIHPEFQQIDLGDSNLNSFFEEMQHDFILMLHVGDPLVSANNYSTPAKLAAILDRFPALTVIAAHMGGYCFWQQSYEVLAGRRLFFDTSSAVSYMPEEMVKLMIDKHGSEQILFGSDYPLRSSSQDFAVMDSFHWLDEVQRSAIYGRNAEFLFSF